MLITGFPAGLLRTNCYVVAPREGGEAIVIDPGQNAVRPLRQLLKKHRLTPAAVLLTHGHIDHIWTARKVSDDFGIPAYIHHGDRAMLCDPIKGYGPRLGQVVAGVMFSEPKQVAEVDDGDVLDVAGVRVTVDHTPGHTPGSVVFRLSTEADGRAVDTVFTGDTLFRQSVGRTDLWGGSGRDLLNAIVTKLLVLHDDTVVLPGHGDPSTIGAERRDNPFIEGLSP